MDHDEHNVQLWELVALVLNAWRAVLLYQLVNCQQLGPILSLRTVNQHDSTKTAYAVTDWDSFRHTKRLFFFTTKSSSVMWLNKPSYSRRRCRASDRTDV
jgi:hypothetical protein